jgi:hypothetical protein
MPLSVRQRRAYTPPPQVTGDDIEVYFAEDQYGPTA